jgi:hypothetical protein
MKSTHTPPHSTSTITVSILALAVILGAILYPFSAALAQRAAIKPDPFVEHGRLMERAILLKDITKIKLLLKNNYIDPNGFDDIVSEKIVRKTYLGIILHPGFMNIEILKIFISAGARELYDCRTNQNGIGYVFYQAMARNRLDILIPLLQTGDFPSIPLPNCNGTVSHLETTMRGRTFSPSSSDKDELVRLINLYPLERTKPHIEGSGNTDWHFAIRHMYGLTLDDARTRFEFFARISPNRNIDIDTMLLQNSQGFNAANLWRRIMLHQTGGPSPFFDCHLISSSDQSIRSSIFKDFFGAQKWAIFSENDSINPIPIIKRCMRI